MTNFCGIHPGLKFIVSNLEGEGNKKWLCIWNEFRGFLWFDGEVVFVGKNKRMCED